MPIWHLLFDGHLPNSKDFFQPKIKLILTTQSIKSITRLTLLTSVPSAPMDVSTQWFHGKIFNFVFSFVVSTNFNNNSNCSVKLVLPFPIFILLEDSHWCGSVMIQNIHQPSIEKNYLTIKVVKMEQKFFDWTYPFRRLKFCQIQFVWSLDKAWCSFEKQRKTYTIKYDHSREQGEIQTLFSLWPLKFASHSIHVWSWFVRMKMIELEAKHRT
jgi:hypothetical protein